MSLRRDLLSPGELAGSARADREEEARGTYGDVLDCLDDERILSCVSSKAGPLETSRRAEDMASESFVIVGRKRVS
jgi:hypothetical protein